MSAETMEWSIENRSLYMRMYRSVLEGDAYYPAPLAAGVNELIARGHAESLGAGYRLTGDGIRAWMRINEPPKEAMMTLGITHVNTMHKLRAALGELPAKRLDGRALRKLINAKLVTMTTEGIAVLTTAGYEYLEELNDTAAANGAGDVVTPEVADQVAAPAPQACKRVCDSCIYRLVLHALALRNDEARVMLDWIDLVEAVVKEARANP
jgi:hypothetical protein